MPKPRLEFAMTKVQSAGSVETLAVEQALQQALAHHQAGRWQEAKRLYHAILQVHPDHPEGNYNLGLLAMQSGHPAAGLTHFETALAQLFTEERYAEAKQQAQQLTKRFPQHGFGWKVLGAICQRQGNSTDGQSFMQQAVALTPGDSEAHCNLGNILRDLARLAEAEASYRRALALKPDYAEVYSILGLTLHDLGRLDQAETCCRRVLRIMPDFAGARYNLGITLHALDRLDEAKTEFLGALQISPDYAQAYCNLGIVLHQLGDLWQAENSYRRAYILDPDFAEGLCNFAHLLCDLDHLDQAAIMYQKALTMDPNNSGLDAAVNLAVLHYLAGNIEQCRSMLQSSQRIQAKADIKHRNARRYWLYLDKLLSLQQSPTQGGNHSQNLAILYVIGDSHTLSAHTSVVRYRGKNMRCLAEWIPGCKQWHLGNSKGNRYKHKFEAVMARLPPASTVLLCIGEIDCRHDEGIMRAQKSDPARTLADFTQSTVDAYVRYITAIGTRYGHRIIVGGVPSANLPVEARTAAEAPQLFKLIQMFNARLRERALDAGMDFLDVRALTDRGDGATNGEWHIDNTHLLPGAVVEAFERHCHARSEAIGTTSVEGIEPSTQEIDILVALFTQGRHPEGKKLARSLTERFPGHGFGWKALGCVLKLAGSNEDALAPLQKAAVLWPIDAETQSNLGVVLRDLNRLDEAAASFRRALEIEPASAETYCNLGIVLRQSGHLIDAEAHYRRALEISPQYAEAHYSLGNALRDIGRLDEAASSFRQALSIKPDYAKAQNNLGGLLQVMATPAQAENSYRQLLEIRPDYVEAHCNLGVILMDLGRPYDGATSFRRALELDPALAEAHYNLGNVLHRLQRLQAAETSFRRALQVRSAYAEAHSNLGNTLYDLGRLDEAQICYRRALGFNPDFAEAHNNLGNIFKDLGWLDEAEVCYRQALLCDPTYAQARSNLMFLLNYNSDIGSYYLEEARRYGRTVSDKVSSQFAVWSCRVPPQRLRVGLVSGDLRTHPVGYFLERLLTRLDPRFVELIAYPSYDQVDEITERIRPHFSSWKPLFNKSDEEAARQIHDDGVHVLVDLSGHTRHNRLPVFAWKPAPVQVSWLGYFASTGVSQIDYFLGDRYIAPEEEADNFVEQIWRLPNYYLCFTPPNLDLAVSPLSALSAGHITYGCFNNLTKVTDAVVAVWARILAAAPGSKLFLKARMLHDEATRRATLCRFARHGVGPDRLVMEGDSHRAEYLASYHRVDIALDPFPYPGGTTSIEGLWMGVPFITRRGNRFLSRQGESIAHNAGLPDWIAASDEDYVAKAITLASDLDKLAVLRATLRSRILASPLFDATLFARHFEQALWDMWAAKGLGAKRA